MDKKEYQRKYREENRDKINKQRKEYYAKNKERIQELKKKQYNPNKQRDNILKKTYGITAQEYDAMLKKQEHKCACCGIHEKDIKTSNNQFGSKRLVVDHCHATGKIRSLLCNRCNTVIGMVEESTQILYDLEMYLAGYVETKKRASRYG